jgi:hypothetical protein
MKPWHFKSLFGVVTLDGHVLERIRKRASLLGLNPAGALADFDQTAMRVLILGRERVVLRKRAGLLIFERRGAKYYTVNTFVEKPRQSDLDDLFIEDEDGLKKIDAA